MPAFFRCLLAKIAENLPKGIGAITLIQASWMMYIYKGLVQPHIDSVHLSGLWLSAHNFSSGRDYCPPFTARIRRTLPAWQSRNQVFTA